MSGIDVQRKRGELRGEIVAERVERRLEELIRIMNIIAHQLGIISDSEFWEAMKPVIENILGDSRVDKWVYYDEEGFVFDAPSLVEVGVVVRDGAHILVELKSRVGPGDVSVLYRKGVLYERVRGVKPRLLIVGGFIDKEALAVAERLGVEVRPIVECYT